MGVFIMIPTVILLVLAFLFWELYRQECYISISRDVVAVQVTLRIAGDDCTVVLGSVYLPYDAEDLPPLHSKFPPWSPAAH